MKLDGAMFQDEFDMYFARAALQGKELEEQQQSVDNRRGSLPNNASVTNQLKNESAQAFHRRTASCKNPTRRHRGLSPRPGESSGRSPRRRASGAHQEVPLLQANQETVPISLKAPSPRLDMKCHSAPHSRSSSWKKMRRPRSARDLQQAEADANPSPSSQGSPVRTGGRSNSSSSLSGRRESIPLEDVVTAKLEQLKILQADDVCVVRNFTTSSRGIINRGDSFKRRSTASIASVGLPESVLQQETSCGSGNRSRALSVNSQCSTVASSVGTPLVFRVLVLGRHGVGKTALLQQFMTSEYMGAVESNFGKLYLIYTSLQRQTTETGLL